MNKLPLYAFMGAIIWGIHFMSLYAISEFGCIIGLRTGRVIVGITLCLVLVGLYSIYKLRAFSKEVSSNDSAVNFFLIKYGTINNSVFTFIVAFQSIPIFYFKGCL